MRASPLSCGWRIDEARNACFIVRDKQQAGARRSLLEGAWPTCDRQALRVTRRGASLLISPSCRSYQSVID